MTGTGSPAEILPIPSAACEPRARRGRFAALRIGAFAVLGAAGLFAGGFTLFASYIGAMSTPASPPDADAIIVLTGGQARIDAALDLLKSGKGKRLLISGVNPVTKRNELRTATGGDRALFNCCIDFDYEAVDTIGNAEESAKWVRSHAYGRVILVTNNYHMPRSLLELGRQVDAEVTPYPVVNTRLDAGRWLFEPDAMRVLLTEYVKYLGSLARVVAPHADEHMGIETARAGAADKG